MAYNTLDIIDKVINTAEKIKKMYSDIIMKTKKNSSVYILLNVLIKNIDLNIQCYKSLSLEVENLTGEEIDFVIYDKISFLINEFNQKISIYKDISVKTLFQSSLDIEKDLLALFIDIQGRLVKTQADTNTNAYKLLSKLIFQKEEKIKDLELFTNGYLDS